MATKRYRPLWRQKIMGFSRVTAAAPRPRVHYTTKRHLCQAKCVIKNVMLITLTSARECGKVPPVGLLPDFWLTVKCFGAQNFVMLPTRRLAQPGANCQTLSGW